MEEEPELSEHQKDKQSNDLVQVDGLLGILMNMQAKENSGKSDMSDFRSPNLKSPRNFTAPVSATRHPVGNLRDINDVHKIY